MPKVLAFLCYAIAFVSFVLTAFAHDKVTRVNILGLGLASWVLVPLWNAWPG